MLDGVGQLHAPAALTLVPNGCGGEEKNSQPLPGKSNGLWCENFMTKIYKFPDITL
jgi:hypothetical protein